MSGSSAADTVALQHLIRREQNTHSSMEDIPDPGTPADVHASPEIHTVCLNFNHQTEHKHLQKHAQLHLHSYSHFRIQTLSNHGASQL